MFLYQAPRRPTCRLAGLVGGRGTVGSARDATALPRHNNTSLRQRGPISGDFRLWSIPETVKMHGWGSIAGEAGRNHTAALVGGGC